MMSTVTRASVDEALRANCPECGSEAPNPCVYLPIKDVDPHGGHSLRVWSRMQLTGTPTIRPHNGRFSAAWQQKIKRSRVARRKDAANLVARTAASPELRAIARAHQQWDRVEWLRLALWLRRYGSILQENK